MDRVLVDRNHWFLHHGLGPSRGSEFVLELKNECGIEVRFFGTKEQLIRLALLIGIPPETVELE